MPFGHPVTVCAPNRTKLGASSRDISRGGIGISLSAELARGDYVVVGLTLAEELQIELAGEVRYTEMGTRPGQCHAGLCWLHPHSSDVQLLGSIIEEMGAQLA